MTDGAGSKPGEPKPRTTGATADPWARAGVVVNGVAVLAAVAAGTVAYWQYSATVMQESVKQTIEFLKLSYSPPVKPAEDRVWKVIAENSDTVRNLLRENSDKIMDEETRSKKFKEKLDAIVSQNNLDPDLS